MSRQGAGGNEPPAISEAEFQALAEMIGLDMPEVLIDLLDTYLEESDGLIETIISSYRDEQAQSLLRSVHSLKSSSASIGAMHLSRLCADLEAHLRSPGTTMDVGKQIRLIAAEHGRVSVALQQQKAQLSKS